MGRRLSYRKPSHRVQSRRQRPEDELQRWTAEFVRDVLVPRGWWATHIANERKDKLEASILKGLGVTPGVADWLLRPPPGALHAVRLCPTRTIWIELKSESGSLSKPQREFRDAMVARGDHYCVVRNADQWVTVMRSFGVPVSI